MPRRFPPPWSIEEGSACFIVRDRGGQAVAYVYYFRKLAHRPVAVDAEQWNFLCR